MRNAGTPTLPVPHTMTRYGMARTLSAGRRDAQGERTAIAELRSAAW